MHRVRAQVSGGLSLAHPRHAGGQRVTYDLTVPLRYYSCTGSALRLRCREKPTIKAERLERRVWDEVKGVLQEPSVIIAGIEALGEGGGESLAEEQARAERDLREVQIEEERLVRLYVTGKITEKMLDLQRKFITERMEHLRDKVEDYRTRAATEVSRERMAESVQAWAEQVGKGLDVLSAEEQRGVLRDVVDEITVDGDNNLVITIVIPLEQDEQQIAPQESPFLRSRNPEGRGEEAEKSKGMSANTALSDIRSRTAWLAMSAMTEDLTPLPRTMKVRVGRESIIPPPRRHRWCGPGRALLPLHVGAYGDPIQAAEPL